MGLKRLGELLLMVIRFLSFLIVAVGFLRPSTIFAYEYGLETALIRFLAACTICLGFFMQMAAKSIIKAAEERRNNEPA
ncbi:hypothetical protein C4553_03380 [Candidatus Parcubacteria bacterium]|nr:MAG: hypothetical protein C4553_03380 [Candidatus Parcubacteria bacterium]